jgi:DNA-binding NarL/FixJ family response regulator
MAERKRIRVLIADDHTLFRQGLISLLSAEPDIEVVGEAANGERAVELTHRLRPDVVLMDIHMRGGLSGVEATRHIVAGHPDTRVVILTVSDQDEDLFEAVRAGAQGYLLKDVDADDLVDAIYRAHAGEAMLSPAVAARLMAGFREADRRVMPDIKSVLTERELEVLRHMAVGATNREIAEALVISEHTVKSHVRHILEKLGVENRAQAAALAVQQGLVEGAGPQG